jgi:hypothetical protein
VTVVSYNAYTGREKKAHNGVGDRKERESQNSNDNFEREHFYI